MGIGFTTYIRLWLVYGISTTILYVFIDDAFNAFKHKMNFRLPFVFN